MADDRPTLRLHRLPPRGRQWVTVALVGVIAALLVWIVADNTRSSRSAELAASNASAIAEQVRQACGRRGAVATQLGDLCRQAEEVADRPAELIPGPPGPQGPIGPGGPSGPAGPAGATVVGPSGAPGPAGDPGTDGVAGQTGAAGEPGPAGAEGAEGAEGASGPAGSTGPAGADGPPPQSWTFPCPSLLDPDRRCVCERDPGSPDDAPTYTCDPQDEPEGG